MEAGEQGPRAHLTPHIESLGVPPNFSFTPVYVDKTRQFFCASNIVKASSIS